MATLMDGSTQSGKNFSDDVQKLAADISQIKHDLGGLAKDVSAAAQSGAGVATEQVKHTLESVKKQGIAAAETLGDTMSKHPVSSVGIALGVGFLIGLAISRTRH